MRRLFAVLLGLLVAATAVEAGVRILAPQAKGASGPLLRGELTEPGDHRVKTDEYDVTVHVNRVGFVDKEWADVGPGAASEPPQGPSDAARRPGPATGRPERDAQRTAPGAPRPPPEPGGERAGGPRPGGREGDGGKEIVVIGDSFVQAAQVRPGEGFGARLEAGLRAVGHDVHVLSMGVPGAGQATELGVLETYALPRKPAMVVLGFLVANDVLNNHPLLEGKDDKPFYRLEGGKLVPVDASEYVHGGLLWDVSATYRWVSRTWRAREIAERKMALGKGMPIDLRVHDPEGGPVWDEAWAVTEALVAKMKEECGDIPFRVVLFPDRVQVEKSASEWPAAAGWDFDAAENRAKAMAERHAPTLDLLPTLRAQGGALYLRKDGHWTAAGHAAAAAAAVPFVAEGL